MTLTKQRLRTAFAVATAIGCVDRLAGTTPAAPVIHANPLNGDATRSAAFGVSSGEQVGYSQYQDELNQYGQHPVIWLHSPTTSAVVDLTPHPGWGGQILATDGQIQAGYAGASAIGVAPMAAIWNRSAASFVSLQPVSVQSSKVRAIRENEQVGEVTISVARHAALWRGTPDSMVDLHPRWLGTEEQSVANATDGTRQAGAVFTRGHWRATTWVGTSDSARILPSAENAQVDSEIYDIDGNDLVGTLANHPVIWDANTGELTDLSPTSLSQGEAFAADGGVQVGTLRLPANDWRPHAYLWLGEAQSGIDLHAAIDNPYVRDNAESFARSVVRDGDIIEVSGYWQESNVYWQDPINPYTHAISWTIYIPEPHSIPLVAGGVAMIRRRRRRR